MAMTRLQLRNAVIGNLQDRTDKNSEIDIALDLALEEIGKAHDFKDMITLQGDDEWYKVTQTFTDGTWTVASKILTKTGAFASYSFTSGDKIYISGGTDFTVGWYVISSRTDDDNIVLVAATGLSTGNETDVAATYMGDPGSYVLPSGTLRVKSATIVDGTNSVRIDFKTRDWIDEHYPNPAAGETNKPVVGVEEGGRIYVVPWSDSNYDIRLVTTSLPTLAAADASLPTLTVADYALICWATSYIFDLLEKERSSERWMRRYENKALPDAIRSDNKKPAIEHLAEIRTRDVRRTRNSVTALDNVRFDGIGGTY